MHHYLTRRLLLALPTTLVAVLVVFVAVRVVPGNPTDSYLMLKLLGKGAMGLQMPRTQYGEGEPLDDARLEIIERWIIAGAPDD